MDVQQIVALGIVAVAAGSLVLRLWRQTRGKSGGGSCPGCGECGRPPLPAARPAPKATPLITLGTGTRPTRTRAPSREE
uniref:FeoB-associated Cys-rich membrane protein n=1 Tax=uncultured Armatimonadetes bacterium TaxID=157466 RepID=A0A6J4JUB0_9BACT|nr:hypothetical protein AVDCRST_MAG63-4111 [uncultured Armatimonadetes bacterium]